MTAAVLGIALTAMLTGLCAYTISADEMRHHIPARAAHRRAVHDALAAATFMALLAAIVIALLAHLAQ